MKPSMNVGGNALWAKHWVLINESSGFRKCKAVHIDGDLSENVETETGYWSQFPIGAALLRETRCP